MEQSTVPVSHWLTPVYHYASKLASSAAFCFGCSHICLTSCTFSPNVQDTQHSLIPWSWYKIFNWGVRFLSIWSYEILNSNILDFNGGWQHLHFFFATAAWTQLLWHSLHILTHYIRAKDSHQCAFHLSNIFRHQQDVIKFCAECILWAHWSLGY